jgi:hypothetical protein
MSKKNVLLDPERWLSFLTKKFKITADSAMNFIKYLNDLYEDYYTAEDSYLDLFERHHKKLESGNYEIFNSDLVNYFVRNNLENIAEVVTTNQKQVDVEFLLSHIAHIFGEGFIMETLGEQLHDCFVGDDPDLFLRVVEFEKESTTKKVEQVGINLSAAVNKFLIPENGKNTV